jgi:hypothetical protein
MARKNSIKNGKYSDAENARLTAYDHPNYGQDADDRNDEKGEAFLHNRPAENDAAGNLVGQQNMGAYLNANKK